MSNAVQADLIDPSIRVDTIDVSSSVPSASQTLTTRKYSGLYSFQTRLDETSWSCRSLWPWKFRSSACRFLQTDWTGSHKPAPKNDKIDNPCFLACFKRFSHNYPKARNSQPPKLKSCQTATPWVTHVDQVNHQCKRPYLMPTMLLFHWLSSKSMDLARILEGLRVFYSRCSQQGRHKQPHLLSIKTNERLLSTTITISKKGPATRGHQRVFCLLVCPKTRKVVNMDAFWQRL